MGRGKGWTRPDDVHIVNLRNQGYDANMIAAVVDRSPKAVKSRLSKLAKIDGWRIVGYDSSKKPDPEAIQYTVWGERLTSELVELYNAGVPASQMILRYDDDERVGRTTIESKIYELRRAGVLSKSRQNKDIANTIRRNAIKLKAFRLLDKVFLEEEEDECL